MTYESCQHEKKITPNLTLCHDLQNGRHCQYAKVYDGTIVRYCRREKRLTKDILDLPKENSLEGKV